jgi:hypothetical protein
MIRSTGVVVLSAFSRNILLDQCLASIYAADESDSIRKLITHQAGFPEVENVISKFEDSMTSVLRVDGVGRTKLQNINFNYWNGFSVAFKTYEADWVLCVEEDSILSPDVFTFIDYIYNKYSGSRFFRGVNLGSEECDPSLNGTYSLLRYGFHGSAGVITRKTWNSLKIIRTASKLGHSPFDSATERYWQTGFMVTPNITKTMNFGWIGGTHADSDPNQPHFVKMSESWKISEVSPNFTLYNLKHSWGNGCTIYRLRDFPFYFSRFIIGRVITETRPFRGFFRLLRNVWRLVKRKPMI